MRSKNYLWTKLVFSKLMKKVMFKKKSVEKVRKAVDISDVTGK